MKGPAKKAEDCDEAKNAVKRSTQASFRVKIYFFIRQGNLYLCPQTDNMTSKTSCD
jgi:hypothetical protein